MTQQKQIYKCLICGNVVEVLHSGAGELICCENSMELMIGKITEEGTEHHLPVISELPANICRGKDGFIIKIGKTEHPMEGSHYIEWIEINTIDGKSGKKFLKPGDKPESNFHTRTEVKSAKAYCNIHGLWVLEKN